MLAAASPKAEASEMRRQITLVAGVAAAVTWRGGGRPHEVRSPPSPPSSLARQPIPPARRYQALQKGCSALVAVSASRRR
jgi:hypothetical protein